MDEEDFERKSLTEKKLNETAAQKTKIRKNSKLRKNLVADNLLFYLEKLSHVEHEGENVEMQLIKDLIADGSDVNFKNDQYENSLFFVRSEFIILYSIIKLCLL